MRKCEFCGRQFEALRYKKRYFCTQRCYWDSLKGQPSKRKGTSQPLAHLNLGEFAKKGHTSPRKGVKVPYTPHLAHRGNLIEDKNPTWRADEVGKSALHQWIERKLGKSKHCVFCGDTSDRKYAWANKSGEYKREVTDWLRLCYPCHMKYDNVGSRSWETRRRLYG